MTIFRKRSVEVNAIRWTGENVAEIADFTGGHRSVVDDSASHSLLVQTLEGQRRCAAGDWLIRGVEGEYYPCRDSIFTATYEAVDVSKLLELTGLGLIAWGLAQAISIPAGLIFGGAAIVLIGSVTDDEAVGMALKRGVGWIRYAWWRQVARENGVPLPNLRVAQGVVACGCGGDEGCPVCGGTGVVPDPSLRVNTKSPHPPIRVNPQTEEAASRQARAREERAKLRDRTPALSRQDHANGDFERLS